MFKSKEVKKLEQSQKSVKKALKSNNPIKVAIALKKQTQLLQQITPKK